MATRRAVLAQQRQRQHQEVAEAIKRREVAKEKKRSADQARKKTQWANRHDDSGIAAYLARNPVPLCDRLETETILENDDE